jgi:YD repeat-containing protein
MYPLTDGYTTSYSYTQLGSTTSQSDLTGNTTA